MRWTFRKRPRGRRGSQHLDFPAQIVSHHSAEGEDLIPSQAPGGERTKSRICLGLSKNRFLGATAIVEQNHALSRFGFVGDNHLVIEMQASGLEEMQLQGIFLLGLDPLANEQETL